MPLVARHTSFPSLSLKHRHVALTADSWALVYSHNSISLDHGMTRDRPLLDIRNWCVHDFSLWLAQTTKIMTFSDHHLANGLISSYEAKRQVHPRPDWLEPSDILCSLCGCSVQPPLKNLTAMSNEIKSSPGVQGHIYNRVCTLFYQNCQILAVLIHYEP
jgi:hypothetical protein